MIEQCTICGRRVIGFGTNPLNSDCGGDCRACMADCGDTDCDPTREQQAMLDKYHRYGVFRQGHVVSIWTTLKGAQSEAHLEDDGADWRKFSYLDEGVEIRDYWLDNVNHCPTCNSSFSYKMGDDECGICGDKELVDRLLAAGS